MVKRLLLLAVVITQVGIAHAAEAPGAGVFNILSFPASLGEPLLADADVAFISDGFQLRGCKVIRSSGNEVADNQACMTLSFRASSKPTKGTAAVWITPPVTGHYVPAKAANAGPPVTTDHYPSMSLQNSEQGTVVVRVDVAVDGLITACTVAGSSGYSRLDDAARRNICRKLKVIPATLDGEPVASINMTRVTFYVGE